MGWQEEFMKEFNRSCSPPFLPEGFAKAEVLDDERLSIQIGDRDFSIDKYGKATASGSRVGSAVEWTIKRKEGE